MTMRRHRMPAMTAATLVAICGVALPAIAGPDEASDKRKDKQAEKRGDTPMPPDLTPREKKLRAEARKARIESNYDKTKYEEDRWAGDGFVGPDEEWYDPTDWFDEDLRDLNLAYMQWKREQRAEDVAEEIREYRQEQREQGNDVSAWAVPVSGTWDERAAWSAYVLYNDAYYDGYYDGFTDETFGYDYRDELVLGSRPINSAGYADGYYDGFYDRVSGYAMNPAYYVAVDPVMGVYVTDLSERAIRSDAKKRSKDDDRSASDRADRYSADGRDGSGERQDRYWSKDMKVIRGTVSSVSNRSHKSSTGDVTVVKVAFEDGRSVFADLGKESTHDVFEKGDRVTLRGRTTEREGDRVIKVRRLSVNGKPMWNRDNGMMEVSQR